MTCENVRVCTGQVSSPERSSLSPGRTHSGKEASFEKTQSNAEGNHSSKAVDALDGHGNSTLNIFQLLATSYLDFATTHPGDHNARQENTWLSSSKNHDCRRLENEVRLTYT
jgi:hypothetical protein